MVGGTYGRVKFLWGSKGKIKKKLTLTPMDVLGLTIPLKKLILKNGLSKTTSRPLGSVDASNKNFKNFMRADLLRKFITITFQLSFKIYDEIRFVQVCTF